MPDLLSYINKNNFHLARLLKKKNKINKTPFSSVINPEDPDGWLPLLETRVAHPNQKTFIIIFINMLARYNFLFKGLSESLRTPLS